MGRLSASDLRGVFRFLGSVERGTAADPLPKTTMTALREAIGADDAEYFEFRRTDRALLAAAGTYEGDDAPGSEEAMVRFGAQNPLGWRRWTPADGAMRMSERIAFRDLERLEWYQEFMRPNRLRDTLKVWLWASEDTVACVQLWRDSRDFTRHQQDLLAVLHHHLIALRDEALLDGSGTDGVGLTVREAEILSWVARGSTDAEIADRLAIAPATVGKHLENAYAKLGAHSRADALGRVLFGPLDGQA